MTATTTQEAAEVREALAPLWLLLTDAQREAFSRAARMRTYSPGELIYDVGQVPDTLFCLASGKAKLFRNGVGGRAQFLRLLRGGDCFGYRAALAGGNHIAAAAAIEPCRVCTVPLKLLGEALAANLPLCRFFLDQLARLLGTAADRTISLTQKHVRARLAESLLLLRQTYGTKPDGRTIAASISRKDLAHLSNMTTANAIRTLAAFRSEGLLEVQGRSVSIRDEDALRRISDAG
ncbi:MAG: Crp/Fnr family transcriptional regulator [Alloprevotella sp.]|nr:Crp/Fnr family transcriptional regulator [Alloprevotella sp.]